MIYATPNSGASRFIVITCCQESKAGKMSNVHPLACNGSGRECQNRSLPLCVCWLQVCELVSYLALLADWPVLLDGSSAWQPLLVLLVTVAIPVLYSRRIVDFGTKEC